MQLIEEMRLQAELRGAAFCCVVSLEDMDDKQTGGYKRGVVLGFKLDNVFDFAECEMQADHTADAIAAWLQAQHYDALSLSETSTNRHALFDAHSNSVTLPHKTLAVKAGLGWIGRNSLLVTPQYGCKLTLSSLLTNAPLPAENRPPLPNRCGSCMACVRACPTQALSGAKWQPGTTRDALLTIDICRTCLKCMQACPR